MHLRDALPNGLPELVNYLPGENLLSALDNSKVGVVICDRRMRYKALNETVAEIHNVPVRGHYGHSSQQIIGDLADTVIPLWENVFSTGRPSHNLEVTGLLPKRSQEGYWIENLFPITDNRGRIAHVGCFVIEITRPPIFRPSAPETAGEAMLQSVHRLPDLDRDRLVPLSPREREVVRLVAEGKSNKEISSALAISVRTVETHRARLMLKLNATSVAHVVHYAIRNNLVTI